MISTGTKIVLGEGDLIGHVIGCTMYLGRPNADGTHISKDDPYLIMEFTGSDAVDGLIKHLQFLRSNYVKTSVNVD